MVISRDYNHVPGTGDINEWIVNGDCTDVAIVYKSGRAVEGALNQYKWEVGGNFYESAAQIGDRLLITHQHGMFTLSKSLKVINEMQYSARHLPQLYWVVGESAKRVAWFPDNSLFDYPNQVSRVRGWNGKTAFVTYVEGGGKAHLLVNKNLKPIACFDFAGEPVMQFYSSGDIGLVQVSTRDGFRLLCVSDSGQLYQSCCSGYSAAPQLFKTPF